MNIKMVVATRKSQQNFYTETATGRSLAINRPPFLEVRLFPDNTQGLPAVYNQAIRESLQETCTLVFAHDDLHILDYYWCSRLHEGLKHFDVLGLAGNKRRVPMQPTWLHVDTHFTMDTPQNLSGVVGHGDTFPPAHLSLFGTPRQPVKLLDGLLLAVECQTLASKDICFDERFKFHFYDLDFCRQAEIKAISCGTWDLALIHESKGNFCTPEWIEAYETYIKKWGN